ncbi:hypothetical protein POM88_051283 [Heracleum sosnowskyi]|uniref:NAD-dependent epimerase/dehydratase domain-containing protein n=1 Tax=Heracleum sosnowskyi TaxID=360622 RepID=A0AAD8GZ80_9APIA|nr:hypothetical protein POM88_051283 [Heracleum sosnowskyi]
MASLQVWYPSSGHDPFQQEDFLQTINLAAICTPADYNTRPLDTIYNNFIDALPVVKYCSENNKRLIHFSTCEVYGKTIGSYLPKDSPLRQDPAYYILKEDESPCIFGSIEKQRWSYACPKIHSRSKVCIINYFNNMQLHFVSVLLVVYIVSSQG